MIGFIRRYRTYFIMFLFLTAISSSFLAGKHYQDRTQQIQYYNQLQNAVLQMEIQRNQDIELMMLGTQQRPNIRETIREIRVPVATPDCTELGSEWMRIANKILAADP